MPLPQLYIYIELSVDTEKSREYLATCDTDRKIEKNYSCLPLSTCLNCTQCSHDLIIVETKTNMSLARSERYKH